MRPTHLLSVLKSVGKEEGQHCLLAEVVAVDRGHVALVVGELVGVAKARIYDLL